MPAPSSNLVFVASSAAEAGQDFWLSDAEPMEDGNGDWGFGVYASKDVWLATFVYCSQDAALAGRQALIPALQGAVFIATSES